MISNYKTNNYNRLTMTTEMNLTNTAATALTTTKATDKRVSYALEAPSLDRYTSDTDFHDLIVNDFVDAGDLCDLELLQSDDEDENDDEEEETKSVKNLNYNIPLKKKQHSSFSSSSLSEDKDLRRRSSTWSFSLGSFTDSYSEDESAALDEFSSLGTILTKDDHNNRSVLLETPFRVLTILKTSNHSSQSSSASRSICQITLEDGNKDQGQYEGSTNEDSIKKSG